MGNKNRTPKISIAQILWFAAGLFLFGGGLLALGSHSDNLIDIAVFLGLIIMGILQASILES